MIVRLLVLCFVIIHRRGKASNAASLGSIVGNESHKIKSPFIILGYNPLNKFPLYEENTIFVIRVVFFSKGEIGNDKTILLSLKNLYKTVACNSRNDHRFSMTF
ncbi:MAG: Unknown protein [uncultured Aureispira sp.]|uniref:Uncharacterized protein n=1 Tax=uncultured Aureispira sp. TaxID=1331704 RepID=A0A6S6TRK4_9BACT|nr:MAG: Unknown protein [uncultured Aureispira sp.]